MSGSAQISIRGHTQNVPSITVGNIDVVEAGRIVRTATIRDEEYCEPESTPSPEDVISGYRKQGGAADIFTFSQAVPDVEPHYDYPMCWDNAAIVSISTFNNWLDSLGQVTRRNIRLAAKRGVRVARVEFTDPLAAGISAIYNETPIRQGRPFWHFGKGIEAVKRENATYLNRSYFIAATRDDELVGFIKLVRVGELASIMQILAQIRHQDKRPTNAMLAAAVELCATEGLKFLKYCKYVYHGDESDPLTVFKRRHGFRPMQFPRYFVPLTWRGDAAIRLGLHRPPAELLPQRIVRGILKLRSAYYAALSPKVPSTSRV